MSKDISRELESLITIRELGLFALKTLVLLCAGGAAVLLAFAGNLFSAAELNITPGELRFVAMAFLLGLIFAAGSVACTYLFGQFGSDPSSWWAKPGRGLFWMMAPAIVGFALFVFGCGALLFALG